ncbi:MAG: relaxase/mobilization nuclease RlxS [Dongiaceae bacterium]
MQHDDEFQPKLGKIRSRSLPRSTFLREVQKTIGRTSALYWRISGGASRFDGSRIGRGSGTGRLLASRDRYNALRGRRVIIKARLIRLGGSGLNGAKAHLRYLQRDGVTREGAPGGLYDSQQDRCDGGAFLARCNGDRHQFRFIVSAEDAIEYQDLKPLTRRLMLQMEQDLGTKLDWIAVDHYNTAHPHTHIVLRGKDDRGKDLIIAREYLSRGMRERAAELVALDLGPRTDHEIQSRLRAEIEQERFTSLDRNLLREAKTDCLVRSGRDQDSFRQTVRAGRLQKLKRLGLADEISPGQWRLAQDLESVLRRMGERGDIIKALHQELVRARIDRNSTDLVVNGVREIGAPLIGRVITRGLADELSDRHYLIVDAVDGRIHYLEIGNADATEPTPEGTIVAITAKRATVKAVDQTIAAIAEKHGGRYSADLHLKYDLTATEEFVEAHIRRLEAMRRAAVGVERETDGTWIVAPDHLDRALRYERTQARKAPVQVEVLSTLKLDRQTRAEGASWLDRGLVDGDPTVLRDSGFGREVRQALAQRRQWLLEQGLASEQQGSIVYRANLLRILREGELQKVSGQLAGELGLHYIGQEPGRRIEGIYRRRVDLVSGRYALIERSQEFTLVPWRPVLERSLGKHVAGIARGDGAISWTLGRQRGASIS